MAQMKITGYVSYMGKPVPLLDNFVAKEKPPSDATENGGAIIKCIPYENLLRTE